MELLDDTDSQIIKILQSSNACSPRISQIASELNMPPSSVHARIKRLEKTKVIKNYNANMDAKKLGKELTVFALIKLDYPHTEEEIAFDETIAQRIALIGPEIQEVHSMTGDWELLLKLKVKNHDDYYNIVKEIIRVGKRVNKVNALFALKTYAEHNIVYP